MNTLVPLTVALPVIGAAAVAAAGHFAPGWLDNALAVAIAATVTVFCILLVLETGDAPIHYWFGGWHPRNGIAIGIAFNVEPLGAGIAALVGILATAALVQCFDYFEEEAPPHFFALMLVFVGSMIGFALSADLFNLFVFFELMSTVAFALTGYRIEQRSVLQGAINFAVVNTIGSFLLLMGIALVYGRTGALNLAQIGQVLSRHGADALVVVAFALIVVGLLTKAGAVPFHFWLSDAYAVAPAPVCVLFAGVMSDLGVHAIARVYWEGFSGVLDPGAVRGVLLGFGLLTALGGAAMAFLHASVKRMLAFVVISHVGIFLCAIALLTTPGVAGATVYVVADGLAKGALFCCVARLARRTGVTDELHAHGRGRAFVWTGVVFAGGGLALAALPPLAVLAPHAYHAGGYGWLPPLLILASVVTGAAVIRAAGRIFLGLGPADDPLLVSAEREEGERRDTERDRARGAFLWIPAVALLAAGLAIGFSTSVVAHAVEEAMGITDRASLARETLHGVPAPPVPHVHVGAASFGYAALAGALAVAVAWLGLRRRHADGGRIVLRVKLLHDGVVGDYVAWLMVGAAALTGLLTVFTR